MKNLIIAGAVLMASVLSTTVVADANDHSVDQTMQPNLVIYRAADRSSMNYRINVDGKRVGKLKKHAVIGLQLEEGEHVISASDAKRTKMKVVITAGSVTYISGDVDKKHRLSLQKVEPTADAVAAIDSGMTMAQVN